MPTAFAIPAFALITLAGASAPRTSTPAPLSVETPMTIAVDDPEPLDCPFCGGNPTVHVKRMFEIETITLGLAVSLLR
jgi:hypothetical protein